MKKNVGNVDRIVRFVAGAALVVAGAVFAGKGFWWLAILGAVLIGTATIRVCPIYLPFGISTAGK